MNEYKVQFVGLAYFRHEADGRHVLFPDGRAVNEVTPHLATIAVAEDELVGDAPFTGWDEQNIIRTPVHPALTGTETERVLVQFELSGDSIEIEGASSAGDEPLIADAHNGTLQPLTENSDGPRVSIVPEAANTVADVRIRRGVLRATRYPGSNDDGQAAIISELRVPFPGETVTLTIRPKGDAANGVRTITVRNGSEIAIVNASRPHDSFDEDETEHFKIYEQLAPGALTLTQTPRETPIGFPPSESQHLLFVTPGAIGSSVKCSNTCC